MFTVFEAVQASNALDILEDFFRTSVSIALKVHPGDHGGGVTPVPIPNTAVKPSSADGTARVAWWESRTLPGFFSSYRWTGPDAIAGAFFLPSHAALPAAESRC